MLDLWHNDSISSLIAWRISCFRHCFHVPWAWPLLIVLIHAQLHILKHVICKSNVAYSWNKQMKFWCNFLLNWIQQFIVLQVLCLILHRIFFFFFMNHPIFMNHPNACFQTRFTNSLWSINKSTIWLSLCSLSLMFTKHL